jgi:hypothetical protein
MVGGHRNTPEGYDEMSPHVPQRQRSSKARWVVLVVVVSVLGALAITFGIIALVKVMVQPKLDQARAALDAYVDAQRKGVAPTLPAYQATPDRVHADRVLAQSTALDVEVGNWRMGSGDVVCFEGQARGPSGSAPLVAAAWESDGAWRIGLVLSRAGCECSSDEEQTVDCP